MSVRRRKIAERIERSSQSAIVHGTRVRLVEYLKAQGRRGLSRLGRYLKWRQVHGQNS